MTSGDLEVPFTYARDPFIVRFAAIEETRTRSLMMKMRMKMQIMRVSIKSVMGLKKRMLWDY